MNCTRLRWGSVVPVQACRLVSSKVLLTTLSAAALTAALQAQSAAPAGPPQSTQPASARASALPSARSILDRHVEAIGGRAAVMKHSSTQARGTLAIPAAGLTGDMEIYAAKPNKSLVKISIGGVGEVLEGFDGTHAWSLSPMTGPMVLDGKQLEDKRFDAEFHSELRSDERYASMKTLERMEFEGRDCYKLQLERKTGGVDIEFYDVATGLKAGSIVSRETPMGTVTATTVETDYRRFGKLLVPTTVRSQIGPMQQVVTISAVEFDAVAPSVFELPTEIKALLR